MPYPPNWLRCPWCGGHAMDGKATCSQWRCLDQQARWQRVQGPLTCRAYTEGGTLCGEPATTVDAHGWIVVCAAHAPGAQKGGAP